MNKRSGAVTTMIALAVLAGPAQGAKAPEIAVISKLESALNSGDVAAAITLLAPDATARDPWGRIYSNREQIQGWFSDLVKGKYRADSGNRQVMDGGRVIWTSSVADDGLRSLKVAPVDATGEAVVRDEKIASFAIRFSASAHLKVTAAMDAANREIVRAALDAIYNARQAGAVTAFLDSAFMDHDPVPGQKGDREGFQAGVKEMLSAFPDLKVVPDDLLVDADKVTARLTVRGSHAGTFQGVPASGKPFAAQEIQVFRVKDGKIVERWDPENQSMILAQLGVRTAPAAVAAAPQKPAAPPFVAKPSGEWRLVIRDKTDRVVKTLTGTGEMPRTLVWDSAPAPALTVREPAPAPMAAGAARQSIKQAPGPSVTPIKEPAASEALRPAKPPAIPSRTAAKPAGGKKGGLEVPPSQVRKKNGIYWY